VYLNGYAGNVGDVIVSNGPSTPPVWAPPVTGSMKPNGYQILPGGLIIQWGSAYCADTKTYTYPIPFPNKWFSHIMTAVNSIQLEYTFDKTGFTVTPYSDTTTANWIAIGM